MSMSKIFLKVISGFAFIDLSQLKNFKILSIKKTKANNICKYFRKMKLYDLTGTAFYINRGCLKKAKYKVILRYLINKNHPVCFETYLCGYHIKQLEDEKSKH
jgi:hypothetical protein